jgi:hypothetical protein
MPNDLAAAQQLAQWISGKWLSQAIYAAAELSIADHLAQGDQSVSQLAEATKTHAPSLHRLLRALASVGIFRECAPQRFESTPLGDLLRTGAMKAACIMAHSSWHDQAWAQLLHSLHTGESAFEKAHGAPLFDWLAQNTEAAEVFNDAMAASKSYRDYGIAEHYDFARCEQLVDVGGGHASLAISILQKHSRLHAVIADLPHVVEGATQAIQAAGLATRCRVAPCDFFEGVPAGGDVYVLAHVLHDWSDERCVRILANCHKAMQSDAKLLLIESMLLDGNQPDRLKWLDLEMLVLTHGGRERSEQEYRRLLAAAGFELTRTVATGGSRSIIEANVMQST